MTISRNQQTRLSASMEDVFSTVQREKEVVIPADVRLFLESVAQESVALRSSEWQERENLDPENTQ
jgi:hypothetical protein